MKNFIFFQAGTNFQILLIKNIFIKIMRLLEILILAPTP